MITDRLIDIILASSGIAFAAAAIFCTIAFFFWLQHHLD